jgi:hypothetical protein
LLFCEKVIAQYPGLGAKKDDRMEGLLELEWRA